MTTKDNCVSICLPNILKLNLKAMGNHFLIQSCNNSVWYLTGTIKIQSEQKSPEERLRRFDISFPIFLLEIFADQFWHVLTNCIHTTKSWIFFLYHAHVQYSKLATFARPCAFMWNYAFSVVSYCSWNVSSLHHSPYHKIMCNAGRLRCPLKPIAIVTKFLIKCIASVAMTTYPQPSNEIKV